MQNSRRWKNLEEVEREKEEEKENYFVLKLPFLL